MVEVCRLVIETSQSDPRQAKFRRIADILRARVERGDYPDILPGAQVLADEHNVNMLTANRAVNLLCEEGLLHRVPRVGTFVRKHRSRRTHTLGVIVNRLDLAMTSEMVASISDQAHAHAQHVLFFQHRGDPTLERSVLRRVVEGQQVDGLVLLPTETVPALPAVKYLRRSRVPAVVIAHHPIEAWSEHIDVLSPDIYQCVRRGVAHLVSWGHRQIRWVREVNDPIHTTPSMIGAAMDVFQRGYEDAMREVGLSPLAPVPFSTADSEVDPASIGLLRQTTAVFSPFDRQAVRLCYWLTRFGLRVPQDISLISKDGTSLSEDAHISSVRIPADRIGRDAVSILMKRIESPDTAGPYRYEIYPGEMIHRESVGQSPARLSPSGSTPAV